MCGLSKAGRSLSGATILLTGEVTPDVGFLFAGVEYLPAWHTKAPRHWNTPKVTERIAGMLRRPIQQRIVQSLRDWRQPARD
jgi:hypothetical protein